MSSNLMAALAAPIDYWKRSPGAAALVVLASAMKRASGAISIVETTQRGDTDA
jgi:hypothetical protein